MLLSAQQGLDSIPQGHKSSVKFVLKNKNLPRYLAGQTFKYPRDDMGNWAAAVKSSVYKFTGSGLVFTGSHKFDPRSKNIVNLEKNEVVNMEGLTDLIVLKKFYGTLRRDKTYQRRITYILEAPKNFDRAKNVCLVEYGRIFQEVLPLPFPHPLGTF